MQFTRCAVHMREQTRWTEWHGRVAFIEIVLLLLQVLLLNVKQLWARGGRVNWLTIRVRLACVEFIRRASSRAVYEHVLNNLIKVCAQGIEAVLAPFEWNVLWSLFGLFFCFCFLFEQSRMQTKIEWSRLDAKIQAWKLIINLILPSK